MSPSEMVAAILGNLPKKTGKTLDEWIQIVNSSGLAARKERLEWLKKEHQLGHVTAQMVAAEAEGQRFGQEYDNPDALLDAMFSGPKAALRPLLDELLKLARKLGKDVKVSPRKTFVTLSRKRQFAVVKPATQTRIDLGLALGDTKAAGRLLEVRGRSSDDRITHRIPVSSRAGIDAELKQWLKKAYDLDA
jgi:hypothetical protein